MCNLPAALAIARASLFPLLNTCTPIGILGSTLRTSEHTTDIEDTVSGPIFGGLDQGKSLMFSTMTPS